MTAVPVPWLACIVVPGLMLGLGLFVGHAQARLDRGYTKADLECKRAEWRAAGAEPPGTLAHAIACRRQEADRQKEGT